MLEVFLAGYTIDIGHAYQFHVLHAHACLLHLSLLYYTHHADVLALCAPLLNTQVP
jgi:hypothetical protein